LTNEIGEDITNRYLYWSRAIETTFMRTYDKMKAIYDPFCTSF